MEAASDLIFRMYIRVKWIIVVANWMDADLNVSFQWIVQKGSSISLEDWVMAFWLKKKRKEKKKKKRVHGWVIHKKIYNMY